MRMRLALLALSLALLPCRLHSQDPSSLDPGFGVGGLSVVLGLTSPTGGKVAVDSQGRIVVVGTTTVNALTTAIVFRFLPDGSLDTTFGTGGRALLQSSTDARGMGVAIDEDDNIVVLCDFQILGANSIWVYRLLGGGATPGAFDPSFGPPFMGGYVLATSDSNLSRTDCYASAIAIQEDGRIVIAGETFNPAATNSGNWDLVVVRLTPQGWQDPSFNGGNPAYVDFNGGEEYATGVAVDSQGRILVSANFNLFSRVYRLTAGGVPDASVGNAGGAFPLLDSSRVSGSQIWTTGIAVHSDDSVVVCGSQLGGAVSGNKLWVAKYPQASTTADWITEEDYGGVTEISQALAIQPDGRIVVAGWSSNGPGVAVIRYNADGSRDATFNSPFGGFAANFTGGTGETAFGVAVQGNGAIVVTGRNSTSFFAIRLGAPRLSAARVLRFSAGLVNRSSSMRLVTLTNSGNALLTGLRYRIVGGARRDFRLLPPNPQSVAAGGTASCRVFFRPLRLGARNAILRISSGTGATATVRLTGRGR